MKRASKRPKIKASETVITVATVLTNDAPILKAFLREVSQVLNKNFKYYEILLVDNGSTDETAAVLTDIQLDLPNIRVLVMSRAYDQEIGFAAALENSIGDYVVLLDAAYDPPKLIPQLVKTAKSGYDIVIAERKDRSDNTPFERFAAQSFYWLSSKLLGYSFSPNASYYRVFSRRVVNAMTKIRSKNRYLRYYNALIGFSQTSIRYERIHRKESARTRSLFRSINFAVSVLISNSLIPLRLATLIGVIASFINLLFLIYIFFSAVVHTKTPQGWMTTSVINSTMFFLLFVILTILAEYIGRILNEARDQPLYFITEERNSRTIVTEPNRINVV